MAKHIDINGDGQIDVNEFLDAYTLVARKDGWFNPSLTEVVNFYNLRQTVGSVYIQGNTPCQHLCRKKHLWKA